MAKANHKKKKVAKSKSKKVSTILTAQAKKPKVIKLVPMIAKSKSKLISASAVAPKVTRQKKAKVPTEEQRIKAVHLLVEDHYESGKRLAWSFLNKWRVRIEEDEVTSITGAALCEAANRFKPELGVNFKTFLFYYLRGMLLKEITKRVTDSKMRVPVAHLNEANDDARGISLENYYQVDQDSNPENMLDQKQRIELCREATAGLDALEQKVLEQFFGEDESVVDIAKNLGYCRCHISRVKSKALSSLTEKLSSLSPDSPLEDEILSERDALSAARRKYYRGVRGRRKTSESIAA